MPKTLREIVNFTNDDLVKLQAARKLISDVLPALSEAEECGNDCTAFRQSFAAMDQNLATIERIAMPSPIPPGKPHDNT